VAIIFEQDGYRVMVFVRDEHPPAHVHVLYGDVMIVVLIDGGIARFRQDPRRRRRPPDRQIRRAVEIVAERIGDCLEAWNRYHG